MSVVATASAVRVRELSPADLSRWDQMIRAFPNYRITHTVAWLWSLQASGLGSPRFLVIEREGDIVGCWPGLVSEVGPFRVFGSPPPASQTVSMGPAFDPQRITTMELLQAVIPFIEQQLGVHHMEIVSPDLDPSVMLGLGFRDQSWPTYRVPLYPRDERRSFKQLTDSARRNIARGIRQGLEVRFESQERFVNEHYSQIREVYARGGQAVNFNRRRVLQCFRALRDARSLVAVSVYLPNRVNIATGMFSIEGQELILWSWAHRARYRWHRPAELLIWTVMQRALSAGCVTFDLTELGELKSKFGVQLDTRRYRWLKSRYRWLTDMRDIAAKGLHWQRSVRGRMAKLGAPAVFPGLEPIPTLRDALRR
ncbi:MAG TPA: GNAT family N-acetyltransferase [Gemmatimonadales bacterium]|nr:GNAT family N-acetyltransferase [Gemmatimonadales bacterium]